MRPGELISKKRLERWRERGLIRSISLHGGVRPVRDEEVAHSPIHAFTGFGPLREDHDLVRVERAQSIE